MEEKRFKDDKDNLRNALMLSAWLIIPLVVGMSMVAAGTIMINGILVIVGIIIIFVGLFTCLTYLHFVFIDKLRNWYVENKVDKCPHCGK